VVLCVVFRHIRFVAVEIDDQGKFGEIAIIHPVTADLLPFRLFGAVPVYFCQPVIKHGHFFHFRHPAKIQQMY
jgi:hypothetical protein